MTLKSAIEEAKAKLEELIDDWTCFQNPEDFRRKWGNNIPSYAAMHIIETTIQAEFEKVVKECLLLQQVADLKDLQKPFESDKEANAYNEAVKDVLKILGEEKAKP